MVDICINKNHPVFQDLKGKVPLSFASSILEKNPNTSSASIYNQYIGFLQKESIKPNPYNALPLKGNELLYKQYNLLTTDNKVKTVTDLNEGKRWVTSLNKSSKYDFRLRPTTEGHKIFIFEKEQLKPISNQGLLFDEIGIHFGLKAIEILTSDKAKQVFSKGEKANWDLNKILTELSIPKEQKELIKSLDKTKLEDIITDLLANYSYTVEINIAKEHQSRLELEEEGIKNNPSQYYSNLTVPGGTNYTENEIATPAITSSIKGHAQFSTDNGIGWFRSDEQMLGGKQIITKDELTFDDEGRPEETRGENRIIEQGKSTKTRRILEVQSDLFQKGRDKDNLVKNNYIREEEIDEFRTKAKGNQKEFERLYEEALNEKGKFKHNNFLQLLNKDNNWVTFFVKSIIQDSTKKGYEKVLFPSGNTASKVEGHTTLEEFKKQKEDRIKILENKGIKPIKQLDGRYSVAGHKSFNTEKEVFDYEKEKNNNEINQLKQELERVEGPEGFGALKPIYNFYENTVTNILKKQGYTPTVITDEYGNTWNEVTIDKKHLEKILFDEKGKNKNTLSNYITNDSDSKTILSKIAASDNKLNEVAKRLLKSDISVQVKVVNKQFLDNNIDGINLPDGFKAAAGYNTKNRTIYIAKDTNFKYSTEATLIHEILHAYTSQYLNSEDNTITKNFDRLLQHLNKPEISKLFTDKYPLSNVDEMLVGVFTNPQFIADLKNIPPTNTNFKSFWEELLQMFKVIFGIKDKTLFDEIFSASAEIVQESINSNQDYSDIDLVLPDEAPKNTGQQRAISNKLDELGAKASVNSEFYSVDGLTTEFKRVSRVIKQKIGQKSYGLKSNIQQELEIVYQEAGTILHAIQANIIKNAFPQFNKQVTVYEVPLELKTMEEVITKQLQPIIEAAKSRGSVLKSEVFLGNTKSQKGGTTDLLEITQDGNYYVYDLKTRFTEDKSAKRRLNKIIEWSEQTSEYNKMLTSGDEILGVVKGKVLGTYILELDVVKKNNEVKFKGDTSFKGITPEKFLKNRKLENITIVAPTFLRTESDNTNTLIEKLLQQVERLKNYKGKSDTDREVQNKILFSKLELLQDLQLRQDINKLIDHAYTELGYIETLLDNNEIQNQSQFISEQLGLYSHLLDYIEDVPTELEEKLGKVQSLSNKLSKKFDSQSKKIIQTNADLTGTSTAKGFKEDIFAAVKDVSWLKRQVTGISTIDNPLVATAYRVYTESMAKAREKVETMANVIKKSSDEFIKLTEYSTIIEGDKGKETLVQEYSTQFWKDKKKAELTNDANWFKENVTYNNDKYLQRREKELNFIESLEQSTKKTFKFKNPDATDSELNLMVNKDTAAKMKAWDSANKNNSSKYFTPKTKWKNPKWVDIKEGKWKGTAVEEFYDLYISYMEVAANLMPGDVHTNFIANFSKGFIEKTSEIGLLGAIKGKWSGFIDDLSLEYDESYGAKDIITGQNINELYIPGLSKKEQEKSLDLANSLFKFMEGVYRYEELKDVEYIILAVKNQLKKSLFITIDALGKPVENKAVEGELKESSHTLQMFSSWMDGALYGKYKKNDSAFMVKGNGFTEAIGLIKKGSEKKISIGKIIDGFIQYTSLRNLGFNLYAPFVNLGGGSLNMYMTGNSGRFYSKKDMTKAAGLVLGGKTNFPNEDVEKAKLIVDWLKINTGEFNQKTQDELATSKLTKFFNKYNSMSLMKISEQSLQEMGAIAMVLSNQHNLKWDDFQVKEGKLVVETSIINKEAFRQKVIAVNNKNIGGINPDDLMEAKTYIVGRMLMQHRSWLPAMYYNRFGSKQFNYVLEEDIEGRYRTAYRLFKSYFNKSKFQDLTKTEQTNMREAAAELSLLLGTGLLLLLAKSGLDDDDKKEVWYKVSNKLSSRVFSELLFFVDPTFESQYKILLSPAASLGTVGDVGKFIGSAFKETTETDESKLKRNHPTTKAIKLIPGANKIESFFNDLGLIEE